MSGHSPRDLLPFTLEIDGRTWRTPLTGVEACESGNARLKPVAYARGGYYRLEGQGGYEFFYVKGGRLPVMSLQRRVPGRKQWRTWMVDDPLHWRAMRELVLRLPAGRLLVAGLGLGLFAHHLLLERPDITDVEVVEIDPDVIALVAPTLPADPRLRINEGDYYDRIRAGSPPDAVLWDLAVGNQEQTKPDFVKAFVLTAACLPGTPLFCFGLRDTPRPY
jgi:hypothetical protein